MIVILQWSIFWQITDAATQMGIEGAVVHVRNVTRNGKFLRRNDDIDHDVTSGTATVTSLWGGGKEGLIKKKKKKKKIRIYCC